LSIRPAKPITTAVQYSKTVNPTFTDIQIQQEVLGRTNHLHSFNYILRVWYDIYCIKKATSNSYSTVVMFIDVGMCLPSCCLVKLRGGHRQEGDLINLLLLFHNKESELKMWYPARLIAYLMMLLVAQMVQGQKTRWKWV
jgi:hypothetical protein